MTSVIKHRTELAIHMDVITVLRSTHISVYIAIYPLPMHDKFHNLLCNKNSVSFALAHMQCSPSVQCEWDHQFSSVQQCPHTLVPQAVSEAFTQNSSHML